MSEQAREVWFELAKMLDTEKDETKFIELINTALKEASREGFVAGAHWHMRGGRCNEGEERKEALRLWPDNWRREVMSEQDKRAEEEWEHQETDATDLLDPPVTMRASSLAAALQEAERRGAERGPGRVRRTEGLLCAKCELPGVIVEEFEDGDCITTCSCGQQMPEHLTLTETVNILIREAFAVGERRGVEKMREEALIAAYEIVTELSEYGRLCDNITARAYRLLSEKEGPK